jgi:hypothetical protein
MLTTGFPWLHMFGKDKEEGESHDGGGGGVVVASVICIAVGRYLGIVCTTTFLWDVLVGLAVGESVEIIGSNIGGQIIGPVGSIL